VCGLTNQKSGSVWILDPNQLLSSIKHCINITIFFTFCSNFCWIRSYK